MNESRDFTPRRGRPSKATKLETTSASISTDKVNVDLLLPISRIRTIMKSSPDVVQIGHESLIVMTKAAESLVQHLIEGAFECRTKPMEVEYRDLANFVQEAEGGTEFLREIIPQKMKVQDLAALLKAETNEPSGDEIDDYSE